ncbi:MAG TPA: DUF1592 domain-containing protein, partial [Bdellovibrionales bacterium]|nr:DUF1592 domain-containing protein [Bdellovibrionales bacterium]
LALHLSSTQFLIRWEFGDGADAKSVFKLTPFELASKIAFDLTDSTPDDQLLALAASGEITDEKTLRAEAKRLALTERGKYKIRQMFYSWLELREEFDFTNLGTEFVAGLNTAGLAKASLDEIDEFLNYIIFEQQGTYQDLMTSRLSFAKHTGLASIYGHAPVSTVPAVLSSGREGILSRLSYLFSSTPRSNIILRGVAFRRHVLCQNLPTPSQDVINSRNLSNLTEDQIEAMTTRNLVTHMTKEPQCISCHAGINPTGFAFEVFDSLGRLRNSEKIYDKNAQFVRTLPLNTSAEVPIWGGRTIAAENPTQLAEWVSNSPSGQACLAKNIYQFVQKRDAGERDGCHLNHTAEPLQTNGGSILDAFVNAAVNRGTQWKRIQ